METYAILEGNMDRLTKKIKRIQNKCQKYGCDFHFAVVGEEFRELTNLNGEKFTARYVLVEAEGHAIVNGWKFVASVERTENGNILHKAVDVEIPERYYTGKLYCEHCHTKRARKSAYIIQNEETGEFKQVGKTCLCDYTHGMSATGVASFMAAFDEIISGEAPFEGISYTRYINVKEFLRYAAECVRHFGYVKSGGDRRSTSERASDYYGLDHGWFAGAFGQAISQNLRNEMENCHFNADNAENAETVEKALAWLSEQPETNNYMHNLKTACAQEYDAGRNLGLIVSLLPTWRRELEYMAERAREAEAEKASEWVGNVGTRITVAVANITLLTTWQGAYGISYLWKIEDSNGNIFVWKSSVSIPEGTTSIKGTVKEHKEFRGVKQTELTRCRCAA